jgi:hypothetical protein
MPDNTPTRSVLRRRGRAFPALPPTTMTSAETLLRQRRRPFRREAGRPQVRAALLHHTTAASTPLCLDHKGFAVSGPLALLGSAFYAIRVPRLMIYDSRFLPTVDCSSAVALHFAHCGQLAAGLSPTGVRPCWEHQKKAHALHALPPRFFLLSSSILQRPTSLWCREPGPSIRACSTRDACRTGYLLSISDVTY